MHGIAVKLVNLANSCLTIAFFALFGPGEVSCVVRTRMVLRIFYAWLRNRRRSFSTLREQLTLAGAILRIPPEKEGVIAEFGCYKGISTVAMSIAAKYAGRRLLVFDSFEGLPAPVEVRLRQ